VPTEAAAPTTALREGARPPRTAELFAHEYRGLTLGLVSTITLVAFEALATSTILPLVKADLGHLDLYGWTFSAFFLANLIGIVIAGGMLDRLPIRRPFAAGLLLFAVGLGIAGLAPSMEVLVAARFLQGLGGGAVAPTAYVAIGRTLPESLRPRMFAMLSTAWVVPGLVGPAIAGVVADVIHWRAVFLGLLPLLAASGALAVVALGQVPSARASERDATRATARRLPKALVVAAGSGILVVAMTDPRPLVAIGGSIVGLAVLVPAFRGLAPRGTLVAAAGLPAAILLRGLLTFSFFGVDAYVPLLLVDIRGTSAAFAGLALTAATLTWTTGSWVQARRNDQWGARNLAALGFTTVAAGTAGTAIVLLPAISPLAGIVTWAIAGLGMGFAYSTFSIVVLRDAPVAEQGAASSALQLSDTLGTALGTGVAGAIIAAAERGAHVAVGFGGVIALGAASALLGLVLASRIRA
jgi:MFS family permease